MAFYYASLAVAILLGVAGQIALKQSTRTGVGLLAQYLNPLTIIGLGIYFAAAICYIAALKKIPVSVAYPTISASYIIVAVLAHLLWNEPFGWPKLAGILLIGGGVVLINQH
jgi:small multidrug resistance pump